MGLRFQPEKGHRGMGPDGLVELVSRYVAYSFRNTARMDHSKQWDARL
jgi:hypothetical protein